MERVVRHVAIGLFLVASGSADIASAQDTSENQCHARISTQTDETIATSQADELPAGEPIDSFASRETDPSFVRFREDLRADAKLSEREMTGLERQLWQYHHEGGVHQRMRSAAQLSQRTPCAASCFTAMVNFASVAQEAGTGHQRALTMAIRALQDERRAWKRSKEPRKETRWLESLRSRMQGRLDQWQREQERASGKLARRH